MKKLLIIALASALIGCNESGFSEPEKPDNPKFTISFDDHATYDWYKHGLPILSQFNVKGIFYINYELIPEGDLKFLDWIYEEGHIIGHHTCTHTSATSYTDMTELIEREVTQCAEGMARYGEVTMFSYPYGASNTATDAALSEVFESLRGFHDNWDEPIFDDHEGMSIDAAKMDWEAYYDAVDYAVENGLSLHVATHAVYDDCEQASEKRWAICTDDLHRVLDYAQSKGMKMNEGVQN
jgi:peptidoglycan/xylan/chitin deacetylase (PgdA/CDA1 family)